MGLVNKDVTDEQARALAYARLRKFSSNFLIYSDGSAEEGVNNGGAGVVLTTGDPEASQIIATLMRRGSVLPAPMKKEATTMSIALDWIQEHCAATAVFVIATDSQSLCQALIGY